MTAEANIRGLRLVLLGAPGAGKGTQAELLKSRLGFAHISTGDLIRAEITSGSPLAGEMKAIQKAGTLVPDRIVDTLLKNALEKLDGKPVIFDGYPRNRSQAETLDGLLAGKPGRTLCISLKIDEALLTSRITGRVNCKNCKKTYNINSKPPKMAGFCDDCGGPLVQREDDKPETLQARLVTYRNETLPILDYYSARNCLITVDGDGEPEAVFSRLKAAVESAPQA